MQPRIDPVKACPGGYQAMLHLESYIRTTGLEPLLLALVKTRASQINGCAFCLDMHTQEARSHGESEQRLSALPAWRDTPFFSERERAALQWTEAVTNVADTHIPDDAYEVVRGRFTERQIADLTLAIAAINAWNRL